MSAALVLRLLGGFCCVVIAGDASADRRGIRVDGFGDTWVEFAMGSAGCPGTSAGSTLLQRFGFTFSGRDNAAHLVDAYCQVAQPGTLTSANFFYADEPGLDALFGTNPGNMIKGMRYAFLDRNRFDFDTPPSGFQWGLYTFPSGITVVGLYGLVGVTLTSTSYISQGPTQIWNGQVNSYNGEYFCFRSNVYLGNWNGTLSDPGSQCLSTLLDVVFASPFD